MSIFMQTQQGELHSSEEEELLEEEDFIELDPETDEEHMARVEQARRSISATVPLDSPFAVLLADKDLRAELLASFFRVQRVPGFRDWQWAYVNRPFSQQVGAVLQMPPGAGKTLVAQWIILESLIMFPTKRVIFAVPLRVLAKQVQVDVGKVLGMFNIFVKRISWPRDPGVQPVTFHRRPLAEFLPKPPGKRAGFSVQLAEGPGAKVNLQFSNVLVATYEHAAGELRKDPREIAPGAKPIHVGLVIVDEVHNIAKGDSRSVVIDDILFFANTRFVYSNTAGKIGEDVLIKQEDQTVLKEHREFYFKLPRVIGMSGTLEDWTSKRLLEAYPRPQTSTRFVTPPLFHQILTTEQLAAEISQRPQEAPRRKRGPARVMLDKDRFSVQNTVCFVADIVRGLLTERNRQARNPSYRPRRLVVFMSTVAEAEMAYVHLMADPDIAAAAKEAKKAAENPKEPRRFVAPRITLVNTVEQLRQRFETKEALEKKLRFGSTAIYANTMGREVRKNEIEDPDAGRVIASNAVELLESAGIYIHHAQIAQPEVPEDAMQSPEAQRTWSDVVQEQLKEDFVAVFSTSTISVGVNLASTMLGILGPNTMWTVDQAEQMIGRVGREDADAAASAVAVVDSAYYHLPPPVTMTLPDEWFVPRLTALLMFSSGWAQRMAAPEIAAKEAAAKDALDAIMNEDSTDADIFSDEAAEASRALIRSVQRDSTINITPWKNADVRGFFSPEGAADIKLHDEPGNGIARIAIEWNLLSEDGSVTEQCKAALELCKQDMKSLPATMYLLITQFSDSEHPGEESWKIVLLWAMLMTRLPAMWNKWMDPGNATGAKQGEGTKALNTIRLTLGKTGGLLFSSAEARTAASEMLRLYGQAHQQYEGQQDVPGRANSSRVLDFAELFIWGIGLFNQSWPTKRPVDMYNYALDVRAFLNTTLADTRQALTSVSAHLKLDHARLESALDKAYNFLGVAIYPYTEGRPDTNILRALNTQNPKRSLSIATPAAVTFLVPFTPEDSGENPLERRDQTLTVDDILARERVVQSFRAILLAFYISAGYQGPPAALLAAHLKAGEAPVPLKPYPKETAGRTPVPRAKTSRAFGSRSSFNTAASSNTSEAFRF